MSVWIAPGQPVACVVILATFASLYSHEECWFFSFSPAYRLILDFLIPRGAGFFISSFLCTIHGHDRRRGSSGEGDRSWLGLPRRERSGLFSIYRGGLCIFAGCWGGHVKRRCRIGNGTSQGLGNGRTIAVLPGQIGRSLSGGASIKEFGFVSYSSLIDDLMHQFPSSSHRASAAGDVRLSE